MRARNLLQEDVMAVNPKRPIRYLEDFFATMGTQALSTGALILIACSLLVGCSPVGELFAASDGSSGSDRYAQLIMQGVKGEPSHRELSHRSRRELPHREGDWILESDIPRDLPQTKLMMIWEVSDYSPGTLPTPEQQKAAADLVEQCHDSARRHGWADFDKARADGFKFRDPRHFANEAFMLDDISLDPDRPENLTYYPTPDGKMRLTGFMFFAKSVDDRGPQFGGPLTVWHYHVWKTPQCLIGNVLGSSWAKGGKTCEKGKPSHRSGEMIHVWLIDQPEGPFASAMAIPDQLLAQGLKKRMLEHGY